MQALWQMHRPIVMKNISAFLSLSTYLNQYKVDMMNDSFLYFMEIVNDYDLDEDHCFPYYLASRLRERTAKRIEVKYNFPSELIKDEDLDSYSEFVDEEARQKHREKMKLFQFAMRKLTTKQLEAVHLYYYQGYTQENAGKLLGISQIGFRKRLKQ